MDFGKINDLVDLYLYDIKIIDYETHKKYTGVDNKLILENVKKLTDLNKDIIIRIPLIPGCTDDVQNIKGIADFIVAQLKCKIARAELLPYNSLAETKYYQSSIYKGGSFGEYMLKGKVSQEKDYLLGLKDIFEKRDIPVFLESL